MNSSNFSVYFSDSVLFLNSLALWTIISSVVFKQRPKGNKSLLLHMVNVINQLSYEIFWTTMAVETQLQKEVQDRSCHTFIPTMHLPLMLIIPGICSSLVDLYLYQLVFIMNQHTNIQ